MVTIIIGEHLNNIYRTFMYKMVKMERRGIKNKKVLQVNPTKSVDINVK